MNPPQARQLRKTVNRVFTARQAESLRPAAEALADHLTSLLARHRTADLYAAYAEPATAALVCHVLGTTAHDWRFVHGMSQAAFSVVQPGEAGQAARAWDRLYGYYHRVVAANRAHPGTELVPQLLAAMPAAGYSLPQTVRTLATVSNGAPAILPVLAVALVWLLQHPKTVRACLHGGQSWQAVTGHLLAHRALFPVALPRHATQPIHLGGHRIPEGTVVLPSLAAAARHAHAPADLAFGAGPHRCPGDLITRMTLTVFLQTFFRRFPTARLDGPLHWDSGEPCPRPGRSRPR